MAGCAAGAADRFDLWARFAAAAGIREMAEIGVWKGAFAEAMLARCPDIARYWMVDPWRRLDGWERPLNVDELEACYEEALERTAFASARRTVLRGTTLEAVPSIPDGSLDFAYVDGDHTLRGITIDLINILPKIRPGGWIGGDDFHPRIAHHSRHEPMLVFPFAVHFAEAMRLPIFALPFRQFLIVNAPGRFVFHDPQGLYRDVELRRHLPASTLWRLRVSEGWRRLRGR